MKKTVGDCLAREGKEFHVLITLGTNDEYIYPLTREFPNLQ